MRLLASARSEHSPTWVVSNGETTVGPVDTELLVRGVRQGKIPRDCWVRDVRSERWRKVEQVREVRALTTSLPTGSSFAPSARALEAARDDGEVFLFLLHGAASATGSTIGALHRFREPIPLPVTSCVLGLSAQRLGEVIPAGDPILALARRGEVAVGSPDQSYEVRHLATRLNPGLELCAAAMIPVLYGTELIAMLEL
ncbi:MAG TPA: hypothetical protein VGP93_20460, partial [Polyangiaceae bacterium]|nr:hypothetical protein [Polyangiaceae bacterium]